MLRSALTGSRANWPLEHGRDVIGITIGSGISATQPAWRDSSESVFYLRCGSAEGAVSLAERSRCRARAMFPETGGFTPTCGRGGAGSRLPSAGRARPDSRERTRRDGDVFGEYNSGRWHDRRSTSSAPCDRAGHRVRRCHEHPRAAVGARVVGLSTAAKVMRW